VRRPCPGGRVARDQRLQAARVYLLTHQPFVADEHRWRGQSLFFRDSGSLAQPLRQGGLRLHVEGVDDELRILVLQVVQGQLYPVAVPAALPRSRMNRPARSRR
jgi:hypothetical protein